MSVQELVEQGEIYIMTHCSFSSADQAGLIPERVACLDCPSDHIVTENGIKICDKMHFFKGDKQSIQGGWPLLLYCMQLQYNGIL